MESFIKTPRLEDAKKFLQTIDKKKEICIKVLYEPDSIIFASLLLKYTENIAGISFSSNCEIELRNEQSGKKIRVFNNEFFIGNSSFTSLLPITTEDILPILAGITADTILQRRNYSNWEIEVFKGMENLNVKIEKNLKIPAYHDLPLFMSLMESLDPYIPEITGNRENAVKTVNELGVNELTKLHELSDSQLNTLLFKIISLILKINPKVTRDDIITDRVTYLNYDSLELALALIYFLDTVGSKILVEFSLNPGISGTLIEKFRERIMKGFDVKIVEENKRYYVVESELKSPKLLQLILLQKQSIRKDKLIVVKDDNKLYTSRFFIDSTEEGLIKIDS